MKAASAIPAPRRVLRAARRVPFEAWAWAAGLVALAATDPAGPGLLTFCGFEHLGLLGLAGLERCPGCGLGHSVAFLLEGQFGPALRAHPLGPFALAVLGGRVVTLVRSAFRTAPPTRRS